MKLIIKVRSTPVKTSYWISEVSYFPHSKCSNIYGLNVSVNRVQKVSVRSSNTRRSNKGELTLLYTVKFRVSKSKNMYLSSLKRFAPTWGLIYHAFEFGDRILNPGTSICIFIHQTLLVSWNKTSSFAAKPEVIPVESTVTAVLGSEAILSVTVKADPPATPDQIAWWVL